jgi:uncharacterized protein (TIGR02147 family)
MAPAKPQIFAYLDYRAFLADFYEYSKSSTVFFSYQYMAQKLGMDTSNLAKVLLGKRHLPPSALEKCDRLCAFSETESEYFDLLAQWAKARNDQKGREIFERLLLLQGSRPKILEALGYAFYAHWYYTAIYALLDCMEFTGNFKDLAARLTPQIPISDIREAVQTLVELGLVTISSTGRYTVSDKRLTTGEKWKSYAVESFQKETLALALAALKNVRKSERDISTLTFSASAEDIESVRLLTKEYRRAVMDLIAKSGSGERVYQLNMQLFPLSTAPGDDR